MTLPGAALVVVLEEVAMAQMPKRTEERVSRHRSKAEAAAVQRPDGAEHVVQPPADEGWCQLAKDLWTSLGQSGQARFYEPSDWSELAVACWFMTSKVNAGRMSGDDLKALHTVLTDHLVSDGARRRVRLELQRPKPKTDPEDLPEGVSDLDARRAALA